ncbi:hypothetical protein M427DRAFT_72648 [Gonapodya prolifera JEL478]|uniref:Uncharacterized protein n=1 Tax=Gonapodya prolifera (strain JEL478) TaxID=1344416 RepID=A0A139A4J5_GONPJ|nr:hypothetical protein M427DRAFT_72648 [Gonapodya prolifera JEL478]|eukprot:KXS11747.1 hypothetical protein M427DRAFT_72648 [Gonapodya prolifera JEL478]
MASDKSAPGLLPTGVLKIDAHSTSANTLAFGLLGFATQVTFIGLLGTGLIEPAGAALVFTFFVVTGVLQLVIAGVHLVGKNNLLACTAMVTFGGYVTSIGLFQLLVMSDTIKVGGPIKDSLTAMFTLYAYITFMCMVATLKTNLANVINFFGVFVMFALSAAGSHTESPAVNLAAAWVGLFTGISAYYSASAVFLGEFFEYPVLPVGDLSRFWNRKSAAARGIQRHMSEATIFVSSEVEA